MDKKYRTRNGESIRILCIDGPNKQYPVIVIRNNKSITIYTHDGHFTIFQTPHMHDLVEISPYETWEIDKKVWVKFEHDNMFYPRHFAGLDTNNAPTVFTNGCTSHTTKNKTYPIEITDQNPFNP